MGGGRKILNCMWGRGTRLKGPSKTRIMRGEQRPRREPSAIAKS